MNPDMELDIVDLNDNVVGQGKASEFMGSDLIFRTSVVLIFNSMGQLLIRKNSNKSVVYPSLWNAPVEISPDSGENYKNAAYRGLFDTFSIRTDLIAVNSFKHFGEKINTIVQLFHAKWDGEIKNLTEDEIKWVDPTQLKIDVIHYPEKFSPLFIEVMNAFYSR